MSDDKEMRIPPAEPAPAQPSLPQPPPQGGGVKNVIVGLLIAFGVLVVLLIVGFGVLLATCRLR
jgi:hypothetical protein